MAKIEISSQKGRFTESELKAEVRASKQFWASPAGIKRQAELDREKRNCKATPTKFPGIASKGTKPALTGGEARTAHCKNILRRVEANRPQI